MRFSRAITSRQAAAPASQTVVAPSNARCWSSKAWRSPGLRATLPTVGWRSPVMTLKIDVLPAPLRPMMPHRSPSSTVKVMFLKSWVAPKEMPTLETERTVTRRREKTRRRRSGAVRPMEDKPVQHVISGASYVEGLLDELGGGKCVRYLILRYLQKYSMIVECLEQIHDPSTGWSEMAQSAVADEVFHALS